MERRPFAALQRGDALMALKLKTAPAIEPLTLSEVKAHLRLDSGSLADNIITAQSITPGAHVVAANYSLVGAGVDVFGYRVLVNLNSGANGADGTVDAKIQESDDNLTWTDWIGGAFVQVTAANDNAVQELEYTGSKQYVRVVATVAGATCEFGADIITEQPYSAEDDFLSDKIIAAREYCEDFQNRAYLTQTWDLWLDSFPSGGCIRIPLPPLQSVTSIKYYDTANVEATMAIADYFVDDKSEPGRLSLAYGKSWPSTTLRPVNGVCIEFVAGYGNAAAAVPKKVKQAMLLLIGHWYVNREAALTGAVSKEIEFAVHALLWMDRVVPV